MSKKTYTDTTYLPKAKGSTNYGADKAGGSASVGRLSHLQTFSIWLKSKHKNVTVPTDQYPKGASHGAFPGVKHYTDNKV